MDTWEPIFGERWRHGGWYVENVRYPNGGVGCVTNNTVFDKHWHMACSEFVEIGFSTRSDAAKAEYIYTTMLARLEKADA